MLSAAIAAGTKRDIRHLHLIAISLLLEIVGRVFHYWRAIRGNGKENRVSGASATTGVRLGGGPVPYSLFPVIGCARG